MAMRRNIFIILMLFFFSLSACSRVEGYKIQDNVEENNEDMSEQDSDSYDFLSLTKYIGENKKYLEESLDLTIDNKIQNCEFLGIIGYTNIDVDEDVNVFAITFHPNSKNVAVEDYKSLFKNKFENVDNDMYVETYIYNEQYKVKMIYTSSEDDKKSLFIDCVQIVKVKDEDNAIEIKDIITDTPEDCLGLVDLITKNYKEIGFGESGLDDKRSLLPNYVGKINTMFLGYPGVAELNYNEDIGVIENVTFYFDDSSTINLNELLDKCKDNFGEMTELSDRGMSRFRDDKYSLVVVHPLEINYSVNPIEVEPVLNYINLGLADESVLDEIKNIYYQENKNQSVDDDAIIKKEYPQIGMTADEVKDSSWGEPKDINKTTTKYGVHEQWVYNDGKYIYLDDGVVTAIQE